MIFAAGLGTRLKPLTDTLPKALVPIQGYPLLEIAIRRLIHFGFREIIINVHHFADLVEALLAEKQNFGVDILVSDERGLLLETGGALKKAKPWLENSPFLLTNVDVLTTLDLQTFIQEHQQSKRLATLAIRSRKSSRYLLFDAQKKLVGWENTKTQQKIITQQTLTQPASYAFSGIHILDPRIFDYMPDHQEVFSIIDVYLKAAAKENIQGYLHDQDLWLDVGKPQQLAQADQLVNSILKDLS